MRIWKKCSNVNRSEGPLWYGSSREPRGVALEKGREDGVGRPDDSGKREKSVEGGGKLKGEKGPFPSRNQGGRGTRKNLKSRRHKGPAQIHRIDWKKRDQSQDETIDLGRRK